MFANGLALLSDFMSSGGPILWAIAALTLVMWSLIFERLYYYYKILDSETESELNNWEARNERQSWHAHQIRDAMISRMNIKINQYLPLLKTLVALCPLMGLLGTVTGMIEVFNIMAVTGGGDARAMAGGVSMATIPTMAGMVAALSGVFANTYLSRKANKESQLFEEHLTMDH